MMGFGGAGAVKVVGAVLVLLDCVGVWVASGQYSQAGNSHLLVFQSVSQCWLVGCLSCGIRIVC